MAEILVMARDSPSRAYRRGDIVTIQADGHEWGRLEGLPDFYLLKVPGVSVTRLERYVADWTDTLNLGPRRLWRLVVDEIPAAIRNKLLTTGALTIGVDVTRAQVEARLRRKDTEVVADLTS